MAIFNSYVSLSEGIGVVNVADWGTTHWWPTFFVANLTGFPAVVRALSGWEAAAGMVKLALEATGSSGWPQKAIPFICKYMLYVRWFGTWLWFFHILGIIIPTDFHIFQRGRSTTNQVNVEEPSILLPVFCCTIFSDSHFWPESSWGVDISAKTSDLGVRMVDRDPSHPEEARKNRGWNVQMIAIYRSWRGKAHLTLTGQ